MPYADPVRQREWKREWKRREYAKNPQRFIALQRADTAARLQARRALVVVTKDRPCMDCDQRYPHYVMDFDHREGTQKVLAVASMVARGYPLDAIKAEIAKCDVVCANCHCIRTHQRREARQTPESQQALMTGTEG